ncbi:TetR/AcrR family transcriptional regulator [Nonomuraea angiospora]|uniref:AcrR family transcriptional regulator n=1 Tax=Nonomuraea angiospora TaxID=46172 RepID=A0ABR9MHN7_9ACTN|nr:TetR/AcrR family transcriptional regulator [Nonomuraea angiospora]MBE1592428.1 AcrR family transcriptional regulator [Nonomuraea angiospora]MDX3100596.1 helix-turn-helix domain containing protein [Nonomuraea angiospora]
MSESLELLVGQPVKERADAARNREKVLAAAARLFAEKGVEAVSMDAVAAAAGVGKGTLFRRFGDKSGLAVALLDARERELQQRVLSGPPPLGPGAPAPERLTAFVAAYLDYLFAHLDLVRMSETASPGARYRIGAYRFWHRHVAILLAECRPGVDADPLAHALLAATGAEAAAALKDAYGPDRAATAVTALATALTTAP